MSSPSALPAFIDRLLAIFDAAVAVPVFDGPWATSGEPIDFVCVGWDGDPDNMDDQFGDIDQPWAEIGALAKNEIVELTCAAVSWSGGDSIKFQRDRAFGYLSDCEQALRAALHSDTALQALVLWCAVSAGAYRPGQLPDSARVRVVFKVGYQARI